MLSKFPTDLVSEFKSAIETLQQIQDKMNSFNKEKKEEKHVSVKFEHNKFDVTGNIIDTAMLDWTLESAGTKKLFNLFGVWIDSIEKGKILIIDELDASLHTQITQELIKLFHSDINSQAQLIFAVHDTNLLKKELFRRDQIWFVDRNKFGASELYSMSDFNATVVRNTTDFRKKYLDMTFGAANSIEISNQLIELMYEQK